MSLIIGDYSVTGNTYAFLKYMETTSFESLQKAELNTMEWHGTLSLEKTLRVLGQTSYTDDLMLQTAYYERIND